MAASTGLTDLDTIQDFVDSNADVSPMGRTRLRRNGGVLQESTDGSPYFAIGASGFNLENYGIRTDNTDNGPAFTQFLTDRRASGRGSRAFADGAPYKFRTAPTDLTAGFTDKAIEIKGMGQGSTYFQADGPLLSAGDFLTPGRNLRFYSMTIGATSQRSAGALVKVTGDMQIADIPPKKTMGIWFVECDLENGFDGVSLVDGAGSKGVCGFVWDGGAHGDARGFAAGGTVFDIFTPNGVINEFRKVTHTETPGVASGSRPFATMRIRGAADLRLQYIESVYARNGLVVDPPAAGQVNTIWADSCIWGSVTDTCVLISPNASASCFGHKFVNNWCDSGTGFIIIGAAAKDILIEGLTVGTCTDGLKISGASSVLASVDVLGGCTRGIYLTGSATDCNIRASFGNRGAANTLGWQADVGVQRFIMHTVGETLCTTGHTDNSGAVSKNLVNL